MTTGALLSGNLFAQSEPPEHGETFEALLRCRNLTIERILSSDRPDSSLYDQMQDEWVCLLRGTASLWIDGETVQLAAGDYCFIPAHRPHRVLSTSGDPPCLWLAVHLHPEMAADDDGG